MADALSYIFRRYDVDDDGFLEPREFFLFLYELGKKDITQDQMDNCLRFVLSAGQTKVSLADFLAGVPRLYTVNFNPPARPVSTAGLVAPNGKKIKKKIVASNLSSVVSDEEHPATGYEKLVFEEKTLNRLKKEGQTPRASLSQNARPSLSGLGPPSLNSLNASPAVSSDVLNQ
jgi:hypothetical protein